MPKKRKQDKKKPRRRHGRWTPQGLLNTIMHDSNDAIVVQDFQGRILTWNRGAELLYGYNAVEALGRKMSNFIPESGRQEETTTLERLRQGHVVDSYERQRLAKHGGILTVHVVSTIVNDEAGSPSAVVTTTRDITGERHNQAALVEARDHIEKRIGKRTADLKRANQDVCSEKELLRVTLACIGDAVITTDTAANITYLNPVAEELTGWSNQEALGLPLPEVFMILNDGSRMTATDPVQKCLRDGQIRGLANDTLLVRRNGRELAIDDAAAPIFDAQGRMIGAVLIFRDVTERRRMVRHMAHRATHDSLTGLVNRHEFEHRLKQLLVPRGGNHQHALLYLDLDRFKAVNDACGHAAGDLLLQQVGALLQSRLRSRDTLARLGGDEFGILLEHSSMGDALHIAKALQKTIEDFLFTWEGGKNFPIGVSIGLVPLAAGGGSLSSLLNAADVACYAAKKKGRNCVQVYQDSSALAAEGQNETQSTNSLRKALADERFRLYRQPVVSLGQHNPGIAQSEILLRLLGKEGDLILPGAFMPTAKLHHQMASIDRWVVHTTLKALGERLTASPLVHSINISAESLSDDGFPSFVLEQINRNRVPSSGLCFEITESSAIADITGTARFISVLKNEGCCFALDNFGSGLSSFECLRNLTVEYVKIDASRVKNMTHNPLDHAMVEMIHRIVHEMGLRSIAKGVETEDTLERLKTIGLDYAQGYGIARPSAWDSAADLD